MRHFLCYVLYKSMTYLSKYSGIAIITILAAVPGIIWAFQAATPNSFSSLGSAALSVGKLLGLSGMALFSLNFILAARLKFTEPLFRGLNRAYIVHHFVGGLALIFLLPCTSCSSQVTSLSFPCCAATCRR